MRQFVSAVRAFSANQQGSTAIEYGLIAALMAITAIAGMSLFGNSLNGLFNYVSNNVSNAALD